MGNPTDGEKTAKKGKIKAGGDKKFLQPRGQQAAL
jgi:hypothetical protein